MTRRWLSFRTLCFMTGLGRSVLWTVDLEVRGCKCRSIGVGVEFWIFVVEAARMVDYATLRCNCKKSFGRGSRYLLIETLED